MNKREIMHSSITREAAFKLAQKMKCRISLLANGIIICDTGCWQCMQ